MNKPKPEDYPKYYHPYMEVMPDTITLDVFKNSLIETTLLLKDLPEEKGNYAYGEGKWTIKDVIQHMTDVERVMTYRALRIARGDQTDLPGFNQNDYADRIDTSKFPMAAVLEDFALVRASSAMLFRTFDEKDLENKATIDGRSITLRALVYLILGHEKHHRNVLEEKYLK